MKNLIYSWRTRKAENGYEYEVTKTVSLSEPINGVYAITGVEKRGVMPTRAKAKSIAQKWVRYYKSQQKKVA